VRLIRAIAAKKFFRIRGGGRKMKVASVTMMLTHCHKCGFHVRSGRLTFQFTAWLKGFFAVAVLSHAKTFPTKVSARNCASKGLTSGSVIASLIQLSIWR
jgi:hypothetical protein